LSKQNIEEALLWVLEKPFKSETVITEKFHLVIYTKRMFLEAFENGLGNFRKTDKNLGIKKWQIPVSIKNNL